MDTHHFLKATQALSDEKIFDTLATHHAADAQTIRDEVFYDVFAGRAISGKMVNIVESFDNGRVNGRELNTLVISSAISLLGFTCFVRARCQAFEVHLQKAGDAGALAPYKEFFGKLIKGALASEQPHGTFIRNAFAHGDFDLALSENELRFNSSAGGIVIDPLLFFNEVCPQVFRYFQLLYFVKSGSTMLPEALQRLKQ